MKNPFRRILDSCPDPLQVLRTSAYVVEHARYVKINHIAIARAADTLVEKRIQPPVWNYDFHYFDGKERTVNYLFLLDALNFCFWGKPKWGIRYKGTRIDGYWALAASLKRAVEKNPSIADAEFMSRVSPQELADILHGTSTIPLFSERWRNMRQLGTVLHEQWNGDAAQMVESAQGDAVQLAQRVVHDLASFNDTAVYENREVRFFKRAQILVCDLWGTFGGKNWGEFEHLDALTAFADYKLPQILRAWGILRYAATLAGKVDAQVELAAGSAEEIEIRAATIWAVEFLREALAARRRKLWSTQVDWILWEASQAKVKGMKPYHRVRTIYY